MSLCVADIRKTLVSGLSELGLTIDDSVINKIIAYFILLLNQNKSINLISPKQDLQTQTAVHLVDSLSLMMLETVPGQLEAMDFGSGGGLPAIPLSLVFDNWHYTLFESTGKKAAFLSQVKNELEVNNMTVINKFLEPGVNPEEVKYDLITARAVSDISKLAAIGAPRLKKGGLLVAFKGPQGLGELNKAATELKRRNMGLVARRDFILPFVNAQRSLFVFKKF